MGLKEIAGMDLTEYASDEYFTQVNQGLKKIQAMPLSREAFDRMCKPQVNCWGAKKVFYHYLTRDGMLHTMGR